MPLEAAGAVGALLRAWPLPRAAEPGSGRAGPLGPANPPPTQAGSFPGSGGGLLPGLAGNWDHPGGAETETPALTGAGLLRGSGGVLQRHRGVAKGCGGARGGRWREGSARCARSPPGLTLLSPTPNRPEHGEGGRAVRDAHRGLRRVLPDPALAHHHLRLRVEVVGARGGRGAREGAAGSRAGGAAGSRGRRRAWGPGPTSLPPPPPPLGPSAFPPRPRPPLPHCCPPVLMALMAGAGRAGVPAAP